MSMGDLVVLRDVLRGYGRVVVGFSGGADSAFLSWVATDTLGGDNALIVTAVSPSFAASEREDCTSLAAEWSMNWVEVFTDEMDEEGYLANAGDRCSYCKHALMDAVQPAADEMGATVLLGVNVDDLGDHRPGQKTAAAMGAKFPLVEAGFDKSDVREESRRLGLRTWDKPAAACLASRIPYGTPVTLGTLSAIEHAEISLRRLGFRDLRVRHYGDTARIEIRLEDLPKVLDYRDKIVEGIRSAGYRYVTLDLEGLRSGNLNAALEVSASGAASVPRTASGPVVGDLPAGIGEVARLEEQAVDRARERHLLVDAEFAPVEHLT